MSSRACAGVPVSVDVDPAVARASLDAHGLGGQLNGRTRWQGHARRRPSWPSPRQCVTSHVAPALRNCHVRGGSRPTLRQVAPGSGLQRRRQQEYGPHRHTVPDGAGTRRAAVHKARAHATCASRYMSSNFAPANTTSTEDADRNRGRQYTYRHGTHTRSITPTSVTSRIRQSQSGRQPLQRQHVATFIAGNPRQGGREPGRHQDPLDEHDDPVHGRVHPAGARDVAGDDRRRVDLAGAGHPPRLEPAGAAAQHAEHDQDHAASAAGAALRRRRSTTARRHARVRAPPTSTTAGAARPRRRSTASRRRASGRWPRACRGSRARAAPASASTTPSQRVVLSTVAIIGAPARSARRATARRSRHARPARTSA